MPVSANYLAVILIWSTTPLAIQLSSQSMNIHVAIGFRMLIGFFLAAVVVAIFRSKSALKIKNIKLYFLASLALFPSMSIVYMASTYLSSGLVAVMFSLTPVMSGLMASVVLKEPFFKLHKLMAFVMAIVGFSIIFLDNVVIDGSAVKGILLMLASNMIFCASQVLTKFVGRELKVDPLEKTLGSIAFALPGLLLCWWLFGGTLPAEIDNIGWLSVVYLGVVGSLGGFMAYYYILDKLSVAMISIIPLITPIAALWLGAVLLNEQVTEDIIVGSFCIILGLAVYDGTLVKKLGRWAKRYCNA